MRAALTRTRSLALALLAVAPGGPSLRAQLRSVALLPTPTSGASRKRLPQLSFQAAAAPTRTFFALRIVPFYRHQRSFTSASLGT